MSVFISLNHFYNLRIEGEGTGLGVRNAVIEFRDSCKVLHNHTRITRLVVLSLSGLACLQGAKTLIRIIF
jgi:hypothetical protein